MAEGGEDGTYDVNRWIASVVATTTTAAPTVQNGDTANRNIWSDAAMQMSPPLFRFSEEPPLPVLSFCSSSSPPPPFSPLDPEEQPSFSGWGSGSTSSSSDQEIVENYTRMKESNNEAAKRYRQNKKKKNKELMEEFNYQKARNVELKAKEKRLQEVGDTVRGWLIKYCKK